MKETCQTMDYKTDMMMMKANINNSFTGTSRMKTMPGLEVIILFSGSAQLSMKFQLLIDVELVKISEKFRFKTQILVIYPAHKC